MYTRTYSHPKTKCLVQSHAPVLGASVSCRFGTGYDVADWRDLERKLAVVKALDVGLRRLAYQRWAAEWGCKDFEPDADFQAWRKAAEAKFGRRLKAAGLKAAAPDVSREEAPPRELADSPQRAPSANKARHTPPASQRSSSVQPESGARRRIVVVEEEDDGHELDAEELAALNAARARDEQQCKEAWEAMNAAAAAAEVMKAVSNNLNPNTNPNTNPSPTPPTGPNTNPHPHST